MLLLLLLLEPLFSSAIPHLQGGAIVFSVFLWKLFLIRRLLRVQVLTFAGGGGRHLASPLSVFVIYTSLNNNAHHQFNTGLNSVGTTYCVMEAIQDGPWFIQNFGASEVV